MRKQLLTELSGNARSGIGTRAENVCRVFEGLPMTERHSAKGRPDVPTKKGEAECKSITGTYKKIQIEVPKAQLGNPPTSQEHLKNYIKNNPMIWGVVDNGDVYDVTRALKPTSSGKLTGFGAGGRLGHNYPVDLSKAKLVHKAAGHKYEKLIADIMAGVPPKTAAANHNYPTLGDA